jgi:hypothetical protein
MIVDVSGETFDQAFIRVRDMDASLDEQLRAFSDATRPSRSPMCHSQSSPTWTTDMRCP